VACGATLTGMRRPRSVPVRVAAAMVLAALPLCAWAAGAAGSFIPTPVPPIHVHLPKPQDTAIFDVIVEGKTTDKLESELSGKAGTCLYLERGTVTETTTYRRGRGLALEFDRYGRTALVHRPGRETDATLAVQLATKRTATGGSELTPAFPNNVPPCNAEPQYQHYEYAHNPDCGETVRGHGAAVFSYDEGLLGLAVVEKPKRSRDEFGNCGLDPGTGLTIDFTEAWPTPPSLEDGNLPISRIFGHRHAIKVRLPHSDAVRPGAPGGTRQVGEASLHGTLTEQADNEATVRLIRKRSGGKGGKHR
jgi:hypothetical protein